MNLGLHRRDRVPASSDERLALDGIGRREAFRGAGFGEHPGHELCVLGPGRCRGRRRPPPSRGGAAVQAIRSSSSTTLMATRSMNSNIDGRILPVMATTEPAAACPSRTLPRPSLTSSAGSSRRKVTSVMTPRMPSLPTNNLVRLPARRRPSGAGPEAHRGAVGQDHHGPSTWSVVTPYFTQHSPPALVATLPPMLQISYDDGSGGYHSPYFGDGLFHVGVEQAGLRDRGAGDRVDGDGPHLLGRQHDPAVDGRRPAGQPATGAARYHRNPMGRRPAQNRLYLFGFVGRTPPAGFRPPDPRRGRDDRTPGCRDR